MTTKRLRDPKPKQDRGIFDRLIESWEGLDPEETDRRQAEADYAEQYWAPVNKMRAAGAPRSAKSGTMFVPESSATSREVVSPEEEAATLAEQRYYQEHGRLPTQVEGGRPGAPMAPKEDEAGIDVDLPTAEEDVKARIRKDRMERIKQRR